MKYKTNISNGATSTYIMPEGPEVRRVTDKLRDRLKGKSLLFIEWLPQTKYSPQFEQLSPQLEKILPVTCLDILCRGKQIFFFFDNGLSFISGLGMEGHWYYFRTEERERLDSYLSGGKYAKFCLHFGLQVKTDKVNWQISNTQVYYDDMISYGNFTITTWADAFDKMRKIGPDLLATSTPLCNINSMVRQSLPSEFFQPATLQSFTLAIRSSRRSQMLLCIFLLNHQEYFSGIGNYLLNEILYSARLHPNRILGSLSDMEIERVFQQSLALIAQSYECGGLTHGTFLDPDMEKGTFPIYVYKKEGQLDPNGYLIKRIKTGNGRSSYVVEELQL
ncbi:endonuclease VIII [soil metagenome]